MRMSTSIRQLLLALMCLFGLNASAQFTATVKQGPTSDYSNVGAEFKLTDVAEALGTDTATLVAQLDNMGTTKVFAVIDSTGTVTDYTGNTGEFWLSETGQVHAYSGGAWFVGSNYSQEANVYNVYVGQMPNYFTVSDTLQVKAALVYNGKTVTFDITYLVYVPEAPAPELSISKLNIVGEASVAISQYPRSGFDTDQVFVKLDDAATKLGCPKEDLPYIISKIAYMPKLDATYGMMSDSLTLVTTNSGWMKRAIDSKGDSLWSCGNTGYDVSDNLYTQTYSFNADNDTLSCYIGQYPGVNKAGDKPNFDIYLVYGSNAYKVNYTVNIIEADYHGLEDMTMVGDTTITVNMTVDNNYSYKSIYPNIDNIAAALGVESASISLQAIDSNGSLSSNGTANNGGFWLTQGGIITAWGTGAFWFVEPAASNNYTDIHVGQYPNVPQPGDTATTNLYFVYAEKYYRMQVVLAIDEEDIADEFVSVANRTLNIQALSAGYTWSDYEASISLDDVNALIGTTSPVLYAYISDSLRKASPDTYPETMIYTKIWNMNPTPGFWVDKDGKSRGWNSATQSPWGMYITTSNNKVNFYAMQYDGGSPVGTNYSGKFFLVNEETGKMITVTLNYSIVEKIQTVTEVGSMDVIVPVGEIDTEADIDLTAAAEALGTDVSSLMNSYTLVGRLASGVYCDGVDPVNAGLMFTNEGACDNEGGNIGIQFSEDGTQVIAYANDATEIAESGFVAYATMGFMIEGDNNTAKVYVINIKFMNAEDYAAGIENVKVESNNGKIYDLSGRQVSKPAHGLYIMNGKKYMVK